MEKLDIEEQILSDFIFYVLPIAGKLRGKKENRGARDWKGEGLEVAMYGRHRVYDSEAILEMDSTGGIIP